MAEGSKTKTAGSSKKTSKKNVAEALGGTVPEWATTSAIAQILGKTVRRVQQLTQEGILPTEIPAGGSARRYRTCETVQKYIAHIEAKARESGEAGQMADLTLKKLEAEISLKESQGEIHKLKTAIAKGEYLPAVQAQSELSDFLIVFKKFADAIPARMSGTMAQYADPSAARMMEREMRKELNAMFLSFVNAAQVTQDEEV